MKISTFLNLPYAGTLKQRIPVKDIVEELKAISTEKKIIENSISSIYLIGVLDSTTLRIPPFVNDDYSYEAIYVLHVSLKSRNNVAYLNERIQLVFPNPLIVVYEYNDKYMISLASKRINKIEKNKSVIEIIYSTDFFELYDDKYKLFISKLNVKNMEAHDIMDLYMKLINITYGSRLINLIGYYPINISKGYDLKENIKVIETLINSMHKLEEDYIQASTMAEQMRKHIGILNLQNQINDKINEIKGEISNE